MAVIYPGITPELESQMHCAGDNTWLLLSQDARAERRDKSEVMSGLGQRKGVLMLRLLLVFWLSIP